MSNSGTDLLSDDLKTMVESAISDWLEAMRLTGTQIAKKDIEIEIRSAPHHRPRKLPEGVIAVYSFFLDGKALKVGKAGPKSKARYCSQHYSETAARSTLAKSIKKNPEAAGLISEDITQVGNWIQENTDRVNILIPEHAGNTVLSFLETFLHVRWKPIYEGKQH